MVRRSAPQPPSEFRDRAIEKSLVESAKIAAGVLAKYHRKLESIEKKGAVNLVTAADREAEARVFEYLRHRHPGHGLIGEESWDGSRSAPAGFTWVLDPLDGTTNFAHGLDHYGFSLGVLLDGAPVAGVVLDPSRGDLYHARRGGGAFRNRERLAVTGVSRLRDSLIATGFPYERARKMKELTAIFAEFLRKSQDMRRYGVASLDLALVAAGQFDGYYELSLNAWDVAAGILLVEEAGGRVSDGDGRPVDLFRPAVVAAGPALHKLMVATIRNARRSAEGED